MFFNSGGFVINSGLHVQTGSKTFDRSPLLVFLDYLCSYIDIIVINLTHTIAYTQVLSQWRIYGTCNFVKLKVNCGACDCMAS